jgi:NAD(P)-dependent dehydrogenase (short-subunit alcohol dehydrogenase family)
VIVDRKVAAVTGAGSGIGRALALALAERGCRLALADVDAAGLAQTAAAAAAQGAQVTTASVDVADRAAVYAWAEQVLADYGQINLIFNNAGVALSTTIEGADYADLEWIMNINFWGVVHGTKAFLPHLKASGDGHVINISSVFGLFAQPGMSAYNASKYAVRGFTEALRQELELEGMGVSATCIHPGGVRTAIARNSRVADNMRAITGTDAARARAAFEKLLVTTPEYAAKRILKAVERNPADRRRCLPAGCYAAVVAGRSPAHRASRATVAPSRPPSRL